MNMPTMPTRLRSISLLALGCALNASDAVRRAAGLVRNQLLIVQNRDLRDFLPYEFAPEN